jgi:hypothetical protein
MAIKEKTFPPRKIADLNRQSASNFLSLLKDSRYFPMTFIIGAGVSASAGLPLWNTLLQRICATFFGQWGLDIAERTRSVNSPPESLSIYNLEDDLFDILISDEFIKAAEKFAEEDALLVAQQIKNCIRDVDWRYLLRKIVYNYDSAGNYNIRKSKLIQDLAEFCANSQNLQAVISYNWDNIFEREAKELGVKISPIWEGKQRHNVDSLPIYYPHGYLPLDGGPVTKIILAESDYQQEATEIYSWANLVQIQAFSSSVCVFWGTSMIDPNLRRLLRISIENASTFHYAFLPNKCHNEQTETMLEALFERDLLRLGVKIIRFPVDNLSEDPYSRLPELIKLMRQHIEDKDAIWKNES